MKKLLLFSLTFLALAGATIVALPVVTYAQESQQGLIDDAACVETDTADCIPPTQDPAAGVDPYTGLDCDGNGCNLVNKYLNPFIAVLSILTGLAVVIGIMYGGIQYASSGGDPQKAATARKHIRNSIVALLMFFFLYAFLRFMLPGEGLLIG